MKKTVKKLGLFILIFQFAFLPFISQNTFASSGSQTLTTQADFEAGTLGSGLSSSQTPGDLRLDYQTSIRADTTAENFNLGNTFQDTYTTRVKNDSGGEVVINPVYNYNQYSSPVLDSGYVKNSFLDEARNLLYVSTSGGGLSVINTQGTIDPADDTLIKTYTTATTPAIGNNYVYHSFLDSAHNLIYVSTSSGGLSVINTQGTIDPADDTLVKTYTTATTPAIANNIVLDSFLDSTHNLIYVSTWGGLSVVNTQGTIDPADDTLIKTYTTATTPAIANNIVLDSFLDSTHNLIYVSTSSGGLSVINTQGTIDPADDTLVKTYTTATTPAIGNNYVLDSFLDSTHNLIYVSTGGGLSVINTQGTIDPADDTLVKTYTTATTPAIGNNIVCHSFFDSTHNLIYVSTRRGLSVINLNNTYNTQGVYTKDVDRNSVNLWQTKTAIPTARFSAATGVISEKIYVAGGVNRDTFNILEAYDPVTNTWSTKASMSTGRNSSVSGVINGKLYVAGGKDTDYNALSSLEIYDPATDTWSAGPAMSTKRIGAVGDVYNGKLYVMGGMTGACNNNSEQSMEVYDPDTDTWSTLAPAPIVKSTSGTAKFINGKMYVAGGQNWCDITFSNSLIVYDPATNTWDSAKAPMPYGRAGGTSAVVDGKFLYIGGTNDDWDSVNDIFIYDLVTDSWGIYSTLPDVLHRPMANVIDNNLYVAGGRNSDWESVDTNYLLSSDFLTDPYQKETYSKISWAATTPAGTSIELLYSLNSGQNYESLGTTQGTYYLPADSSAYSLRYKAILSTDDFSVTPSLDSVTVYYATENSGLYPSSGVYTSKVIDANLNSKWETLSAESTIPTNTSISYQTRSGNSPTPDSTWSSWSDTSGSTITSPSNRYLQVKATLATTDDTQTPTLSAMTIDYTNLSVGPVLPSPPSNNNNPGNSNATAPATNEINTPTNTTPGETNGASTPTNTTNPHISMLDDILAEAKILATKDTSLLLNHLGIQADVNKEQAGLIKYQTILDLDKTISNEARLTINDFIVYGTLSTLRLGAGERAAVINSYYRAYSRLPDSEAEWNDLLKIANGRWPNERNSNIENQAKLEFNRVYGRNPEMTNNIDQNTIMVMAYGLMPRPRNLMSEQTAITTFKWIYEHSPVNALAWNIVRAVAYGGAGR